MKYPKRVSSGRYVDLGDFSEEDVQVRDILPALSQMKRFTGHYRNNEPLSVAQHSIMTAMIAEDNGEPVDVVWACLCHDFAEAYIGDVASPIKWFLGNKWYKFAEPIEKAVAKAVCPPLLDKHMHPVVKVYDSASLDIERRMMWSDQRGKALWPTPLLDIGTLADKRDYWNRVQWEKDLPILESWYYALKEKQIGSNTD
jgi:5'-deoxynucleotidase YfbR-like HD superfamily hydrolase